MTDELVKRLRDAKRDWPEFGHDRAEAADRIAALTAERDRLRRGIEHVLDGYGLSGPDYRFPYGEEEADWITDHLIAVMKGETHE